MNVMRAVAGSTQGLEGEMSDVEKRRVELCHASALGSHRNYSWEESEADHDDAGEARLKKTHIATMSPSKRETAYHPLE